MSFYNEYLKYKSFDFKSFFDSIREIDIERVLNKERLNELDFLTLLSSVSEKYLEDMAEKAHRMTVNQFGRVIQFYTPIYLSNYCTNQCIYCGFNLKNKIDRKQLTLKEVEKEAEKIVESGLKHILVLTGDAPLVASIEYIKECCDILKKYTSIAVEIYALDTGGYKELVNSGVDSLTIYQETYNEELYDQLHLMGPKKDYRFRLDAPERGCKAKLRSVGIGTLLGLSDFRHDTFFTALHAN